MTTTAPRSVDPSVEVEHLDVLVIGAGLSGIGAGAYLENKCPWASYTILEARDAIGGTWDLFRYPGIRSDSDMYTLGYSFRPWDGDKAIADGSSILQYIKDTATELGVDRKIRFGHKVVRAEWSSEDALWHVTAEKVATGEQVELTCGFVFSCSGYYRYDHGYQPDFPGMDRFRGQIIHPQAWPEDLDYTGKKVVVIGSGATAVTLIPSMAKDAEHVTMLQRSPTYIASLPQKSPVANLLHRLLPDKQAGQAMRWFMALFTQGSYQLSRRQPGLVAWFLRTAQKRQLPADFDIDVHLKPSYKPWDQRLCVVPDGDLFKAIRHGDASIVTDRVASFTETGLELESGATLDADIVITATGLEMLFMGGVELVVDGDKVDIADRLTYKGMMLEGVPNMAIAVGYTNASWTLKCDLTCDYVCRLLNHLHETGLRQATAENHDAEVSPEPLLGLSSGYVLRAIDRFPKQGSKFPWQVHQSFLKDYRAMKMSDIEDSAMVFSNPAPAAQPASATA